MSEEGAGCNSVGVRMSISVIEGRQVMWETRHLLPLHHENVEPSLVDVLAMAVACDEASAMHIRQKET